MTTEMAQTVIGVCNNKNISVTSADHASYVIAIIKHADQVTTQSQYVTSGQFNLRAYLLGPYKTAECAFLLIHDVSMDSGPASTFWNMVQTLNGHYQTTFKEN
ncbi:hypothetical protein BGW36DRAFT_428256 [Talaromyces proteolyticus]|uniref:Uncharacterized protein n=1 Tax=Talaromyces proteolyticus TaxID=1131652 RepID=A0AAD4KTI0_9EURO|nr:uncharacterized protein BGW36DRAFT_428256 [Talaromyces proteolyticus]KAH8696236.1 hypothetical protein BGW36DRAFT_428256 [Talaromyces proteolyticus]